MKAIQTDPVIAEVHRVRDANAARLDYDVARIFRDIWARQENSNREFARYPPRPAMSDPRAATDQAPSG